MFIQTEPTPNPATMKFIPGKPVLGEGTVDFRAADEAANSPLAQRIFTVDGVTGVFIGDQRRERMAASEAGHPRRHHGALHVGCSGGRRW